MAIHKSVDDEEKRQRKAKIELESDLEHRQDENLLKYSSKFSC